MKTSKEFDYSLWKDSEGNCLVRVKSTGEVTQVEHEVFKLLNAEAVRWYRSNNQNTTENKNENSSKKCVVSVSLSELSDAEQLHLVTNSMGELEEMVATEMLEMEFKTLLTEKQLVIYEHCITQGESFSHCARQLKLSDSTVRQTVNVIRKKWNLYVEYTD